MLITFSWTHKAQPPPDQVQSPMLAVHVYTCVEGFGKGGQVETEFASWCVPPPVNGEVIGRGLGLG